MKIVILGSGVIGVTSAYILAERGHEVTVIERQSGSGMETSFANGGQLSYCHAEPWANPEVLPKIVKWLGRKDAPLVLHPGFDLAMWLWGLRFLRNCTKARARYHTINTLRLALYSREIMKYLRGKTGVDFAFRDAGILHIFKDDKNFESALLQAKMQQEFGASYKSMTYQECMELEPMLLSANDRIIGGIHFPLDESGDIFAFTRHLAKKCQTIGVVFKYDHAILGIDTVGDEVSGVLAGDGVFTADKYIVALGSYSSVFLNKLGVKTHIYPMKGYSVSIPVNVGKAPQVSITDQSQKLVYSRLGNILRVAGTAEFAKYDTSIDEFRTTSILRHAKNLFPEAGDFANVTKWACLRPSTPGGTPVLGRTKFKNLFLNTGHGTLGWTLAAGSARILADFIDDKPAEIDLTGLTLS